MWDHPILWGLFADITIFCIRQGGQNLKIIEIKADCFL